MTDTQLAPPDHPTPVVAAKWWQRRWAQLVGVAVLSLGVGSAAGASGRSDNAHELLALRAQKAALAEQLTNSQGDATSAQQQVATLQDQLSQAKSDAARARADGANALAVAKKEVAAQNAATVTKLNAQAASLRQQAATLARQERAFRQQVSTYNDSTVPGSGLYVVGTDIAPGTYHTTGDDGGGDCYWARLASTDTTNIIDNNNTTGPSTITIYSSDRAFQTEGCADWHKVG